MVEPRQRQDDGVPHPAVAEAADDVERGDDPGARGRAVHPARERALALDPQQLPVRPRGLWPQRALRGHRSCPGVDARSARARLPSEPRARRRRRAAPIAFRRTGRWPSRQTVRSKPASSSGATRHPRDPLGHVLGGRGGIERDHRQARCEGLEGDVAEGLREARKDEQVGRRVARGQRIAALHADEERGRMLRPRSRARSGPSPTTTMRASGRTWRSFSKARSAELDVLLLGDAADAQQHRRIGPGTPGRAQLGVAARRIELGRVDAAADHAEPLEARPRRARARPRASARRSGRCGCGSSAGRAAPPRRAHRGGNRRCSGGSGCGSPNSSRSASSARARSASHGSGPGVARCTRSGRVCGEAAPQRARAGVAEAQLLVEGNRPARASARSSGGATSSSPGWRGRIRSTWCPRSRRIPHRPFHRQGDAVELRRVGFGDVGDAHRNGTAKARRGAANDRAR